MERDLYWKNFALGHELDVSGNFIYNGIKSLDSLEHFYYPSDVFEILYNLSVGIERLLKVTIILIEHSEQTSMKSLKTHSTVELMDRVRLAPGIDCVALSKQHNSFLELLTKFYKSYRYDRYSIDSIYSLKKERDMFLEYLKKYLDIDIKNNNSMLDDTVQNTPQIKKFMGKVVQKIISNLFSIIEEQAGNLNIYTYELRYGSKAQKVFSTDSTNYPLNFINEQNLKKELILYLMLSCKSLNDNVNFLSELTCLDLDPALAPEYIKMLINDAHLDMDILNYEDINNLKDRLGMLSVMTEDVF